MPGNAAGASAGQATGTGYAPTGYTPTTGTGLGNVSSATKSSGIDILSGSVANDPTLNFTLTTGDYYVEPTTGAGQRQEEANRPGGVAPNAPVKAADYFNAVVKDYTTAQIENLQAQLVDAGLLNGKYERGAWDGATRAAFTTLLQSTAMAQAGGQNVSVMGFLQAQVARQAAGSAKPTTVTEQQFTDPEAAKHLLVQAMGQYLGQLPSDEQVAQFTNALQAEEAANPRVETQVTDAQGNVKSDSVTGGIGTDPYRTAQTQFAEDWARAQPGAANYQTVGFLNALFGAAGTAGGIGG
jgi:hypothetical protein